MLSVTLLVITYYLVPMDRSLEVSSAAALFAALLGVSALGIWQVRAIVHSPYPAGRAVESLATSIPLFLLLFAAVYYMMSRSGTAVFNERLTRTDALYFTVTVFSTVGFGDIVPLTETARVVAMIQMLADLLILGALLKAIVSAVRMGQRRKANSAGDESGSSNHDPPAP